MARKDPPEEPLLFDLPLGKGDEGVEEPALRRGPRRSERRGPESLRPLELPLDEPEEESAAVSADPEGRSGAAPRGARFLAGLADGVMHAALAVLGVIGARQMGVHPALADWPGFTLFLLAFSFLYVVVSLAFWGHTLGMVWAGITARSRDGEALSFDQAVRRWLGGSLTAALLGLPLLFAFRGRALSDWLSASATLRR
jgi:uncharacterized RDD family membrane protein YckC